MPLRKCTFVGLGDRIGVQSSARVSRSEDEVGYWMPYPPLVVLARGDTAGLASAIRAALAASIDDPPLRKAPPLKEAYAAFVTALGAASVPAMMATAMMGDLLDDGRALRFIAMQRTRGGFEVNRDAHFELPLDAGDDALAAAVARLLAG